MTRFTSTAPHGVALPGKRSKRKRAMALSPRVPAKLTSNSTMSVPGSPAVSPDPPGKTPPLDPTRKRRNTNANRRTGGPSTYYRPRAEDFAGSIPNATTTAQTPTRTNGTRVHPTKRGYNAQLATAEAEGFRQRAATNHNTMVTLGAVSVNDSGTPHWLNETEE